MSSQLIKLQLAWLDQDLDEFEAHVRLQAFLDAGLDPDLAAAAVSAELHLDEMEDLRGRVEALERTVALLLARLAEGKAE